MQIVSHAQPRSASLLIAKLRMDLAVSEVVSQASPEGDHHLEGQAVP